MNNSKTILVVAVILVITGLVFLSSRPLNSETTDKEETLVQSRIKEFNISISRFEFEPNVLEVNQGDLVRLNISSEDVPHGLAISSQEYNINIQVAPGNEETVEFIASETGEFTFVCSVMCGEGHFNMRGVLKVS